MASRLLAWTSTTIAVTLIATAMGCTALMSETSTPRPPYTPYPTYTLPPSPTGQHQFRSPLTITQEEIPRTPQNRLPTPPWAVPNKVTRGERAPSPTMAPNPAPTLAPSSFGKEIGDKESFYGKAAETLGQAKVAFERGDYQEAIKKFMETQRHHGKPSSVLEGRIGVSYMGLGKYEAAIPHLSKAIEIKDRALLRNNRGGIYMTTGQCDRASEDARAALAMEPIKEDGFHTDVEANLILGRCNYRQGQYMLALQHTESAIEISIREGYTREEISATRIKIGESYEALGQDKKAMAQYSESIDLFDNHTARVQRGILHMASKRCDQAIEDAEAALTMDPKKEDGFHTGVEPNFILASCHAQNGNHLPALQHAEATLEMARTHGYPETYLEAVATMSLSFQAVLEGKIGPEDLLFEPALTHSKTGIDLLNQGDYEAALASFRTAQEMHGTPSGNIQVRIGHTYRAMGQSQNAIRHYTEAIGIRDNALRRIYRGTEHAENGQCTEAAADAEAALRMKPHAEPGFHTGVEAHSILAICLLDQGDNQNALFHIDRAISAARTNSYPAEYISKMSKLRENAQAMG